jgi:hypothetical protein
VFQKNYKSKGYECCEALLGSSQIQLTVGGAGVMVALFFKL